MLFIRATILTMSTSPSTQSQSVNISWLSFWPGFVTSFNRQADELIYIPYSSFNGQSLGLVNSNTEGSGKLISPLCSQWPTTWQYIYIYIYIYKADSQICINIKSYVNTLQTFKACTHAMSICLSVCEPLYLSFSLSLSLSHTHTHTYTHTHKRT